MLQEEPAPGDLDYQRGLAETVAAGRQLALRNWPYLRRHGHPDGSQKESS